MSVMSGFLPKNSLRMEPDMGFSAEQQQYANSIHNSIAESANSDILIAVPWGNLSNTEYEKRELVIKYFGLKEFDEFVYNINLMNSEALDSLYPILKYIDWTKEESEGVKNTRAVKESFQKKYVKAKRYFVYKLMTLYTKFYPNLFESFPEYQHLVIFFGSVVVYKDKTTLHSTIKTATSNKMEKMSIPSFFKSPIKRRRMESGKNQYTTEKKEKSEVSEAASSSPSSSTSSNNDNINFDEIKQKRFRDLYRKQVDKSSYIPFDDEMFACIDKTNEEFAQKVRNVVQTYVYQEDEFENLIEKHPINKLNCFMEYECLFSIGKIFNTVSTFINAPRNMSFSVSVKKTSYKTDNQSSVQAFNIHLSKPLFHVLTTIKNTKGISLHLSSECNPITMFISLVSEKCTVHDNKNTLTFNEIKEKSNNTKHFGDTETLTGTNPLTVVSVTTLSFHKTSKQFLKESMWPDTYYTVSFDDEQSFAEFHENISNILNENNKHISDFYEKHGISFEVDNEEENSNN